ncbi:hypothetical protein BD309DRAFT_896487 [Dichomitus squalens]|uniref:Uncharacterized protein n=1 Tax=Dichomitus squalens TaxID=114155 RepID=A0A4Q9NSC9_9APHY|nr:hypothetical protein BD309DRAFT_896487 [Dichomitus squalens]TBU55125.1 hypothetical protein BD310DRAFT_969454 [Dichomitus squalens]
MDSDYKPLIVSDVQRAICALNGVVVLLQDNTRPTTGSELIEKNYPQATLGQFLAFSQMVVESLGSAHATVSRWLMETGERLMRNLGEGRDVEDALKKTSFELGEADYLAGATEERIQILNAHIVNLNAEFHQAEHELDRAESRLERKTRTRDLARLGGALIIALIPRASETSFVDVLAIVDREALQAPVDEQKEIVSRLESQLRTARDQLQVQTQKLENERAEGLRLCSRIDALRQKAKDLAADARALETARASLAELSVRIHECLRSVNGALNSATSISIMRSMGDVVSGLRGVVVSLGQEAMFSGPLAQLNDAAFAALDRRVSTVRYHRVTA